MRKILAFALVLAGAFLFTPTAQAQFTSVTATVTDPNGIPYGAGTMSAVLVPASPGGWTLSGNPYSGRIGPATLDATGTFTANFGSNAIILPAGSQWQITIDSNQGGVAPPLGTGPQTFVVTMTISGASQNISTTLNAAAPKLANLTIGSGTIGGSIAVNQVAFGSGVNTITGSNNFTYTSGKLLFQDSAIGLTSVASATIGGAGSGTAFSGGSAILEDVLTNNTGYNQIFSNSAGTGNSGAVRQTFLGLTAYSSSFQNPNLVQLAYFVGNVQESQLNFGGGGVFPAGVENGLNFNGDGSGELLTQNPDMTLTDVKVIPNAGIQLKTDASSPVELTCQSTGGCPPLQFDGATSGSAQISVAAVAGTPNKILLPIATGAAGTFLQTNGGNPQQTSWVTATGWSAVSCATVDAMVYWLTSTTGACDPGITTNTTGTLSVTGGITTGGSPPLAIMSSGGTAVTGGWAGASGANPFIPTAGQSGIRVGTGGFSCSLDAGSDSPCLPIVPASVGANHLAAFSGTNGRVIVDGGPQFATLTSPGATTDATTLIQTALTNAVAGSTIILQAGTYALKGTFLTTGASSHLTIQCLSGTILQAQAGFSGNLMLLVAAGSSDTLVQGCVFDGNSLATNAIQINTTALRISVDRNEMKNFTATAAQCAIWTGDKISFTNNWVHNSNKGFYCFVGITTTSSAYVDNNKFDTLTDGTSPIGAGTSGMNYFEASGNSFTNIAPALNLQAVLYSFGADKVDWQHNRFQGVTAAVHCDTCGGGTISFNTAVNDVDTSGFADYFIEVGSNFTIEGNVSINKANERGMILGLGGTGQSIASLRNLVTNFNTTTGFTAGSNVVLTSDGSDHQGVSTASLVATANGGFTTGILWYNNFGASQTSWNPYQDIWIKPTSGSLTAGQLQLCLSVNTAISTCDLSVPLPAIAVNTWYHVIQYATGWEGALQINGQGSPGFNSFGIKVTTSTPSIVVKFDEYDQADELLGYVARSNKIVSPLAGDCFDFGALQNPDIDNNYCQSPGSGIAYNGYNSTQVLFDNNVSQFTNGATPTKHLISNAVASTSAIFAMNDITNATTPYNLVSGGTITNSTIQPTAFPTCPATPAGFTGATGVGMCIGGTGYLTTLSAGNFGTVALEPSAISFLSGTAPATFAARSMCYSDSTALVLECEQNNGPFVYGVTPLQSASTTAVTSSNPTINTDQNLIQISLKAGYFNTLAQSFDIKGSGIYSSTTASSPALTFKAKLCTVSGCGSGTVVPLANIVTSVLNTAALTNATYNLVITCATNATGATGNLVCHGAPGLTLDTGALVSSPDSVFADTNTATLANIDLTAALFVQFTVAQSVVGASNSYTQQLASIR